MTDPLNPFKGAGVELPPITSFLKDELFVMTGIALI